MSTGPFDLHGRTAIVTGAASGIGAATARVLAAAGADVVCADVSAEGADATAASIGGRARAVALDVTDRAAVEALIGSVERLDVLCNIAGIITQSPVLDLDDDDFERVFSVNFRGVLHGSRAAARRMAGEGGGSIVNMASGAIDAAAPGLVSYGVSKAAVVQLTRTLATEVGPHGVRVNCVAPGVVETAMTARHWTEPDGSVDPAKRDGVLGAMARMAPLRRIGQPEDVAWAVLYLASDAGRFVTGQIIRPNGGVSMPW